MRNLSPVTLVAVLFLVFALLFAGLGYLHLYDRLNLTRILSDFYANVSSELASIAITVLIIDGLNRRRDEKLKTTQLQENLIMSSGSISNEVAKDAIHQLRRYKWLYGKHNLLAGANLVGANLENVNLWRANLFRAKLWRSNLSGADLRYANLEEAELLGVDFRGANLYGANLALATIETRFANQLDLHPPTFDETTILPDGTKWVNSVDMKRFIDPAHPEAWKPAPNDVGWLPDWFTDSHVRRPPLP